MSLLTSEEACRTCANSPIFPSYYLCPILLFPNNDFYVLIIYRILSHMYRFSIPNDLDSMFDVVRGAPMPDLRWYSRILFHVFRATQMAILHQIQNQRAASIEF